MLSGLFLSYTDREQSKHYAKCRSNSDFSKGMPTQLPTRPSDRDSKNSQQSSWKSANCKAIDGNEHRDSGMQGSLDLFVYKRHRSNHAKHQKGVVNDFLGDIHQP